MPTSGRSSTDGVTSPPPVSLGSRAKVDLKGKQKLFEERDRQAEKVQAAYVLACLRRQQNASGAVFDLFLRNVGQNLIHTRTVLIDLFFLICHQSTLTCQCNF